MMTAPSKPGMLLDHRGTARPVVDMSLNYDQVRLSTAFHEAGHAVVAMSYGVHIVTSEVMAWSPEPGRCLVTGNTAFRAAAVSPWHFAAHCAAGQVAQVQYLLTHGLWTPERALACDAVHDREQAVDVLADFGYHLGRSHVPAGGKSWGMVQGMARRRIGYHWREIRLVAEAINERTILTGHEIAALTGLVNPPRPERGVA